jgi:hypothetical protein
MTGLLFLIAFFGLPILGLPLMPSSLLRKLHPGAICGVAGVVGALLLCAEMLVLTWTGVRWGFWVLILPSAGLATVRGAAVHRARRRSQRRWLEL